MTPLNPERETPNETVVRQFYEALWNPWNLDLYDKLVAPDAVFHAALSEVHGKAEFIETFDAFRRGFPDLDNQVQQVVGAGDYVTAVLRYVGTHEGTFAGIEATGKRVVFGGVNLFRVVDARIVEARIQVDRLTLFRDIGGVVPAPGLQLDRRDKGPGSAVDMSVLHVAINCRDPIASEAFYTECFGFRRARVYNPGPEQVVILKLGQMRLEMFKATGEAPPYTGGTAGPVYPCWRHLALRVDDVDAVLKRLEGRFDVRLDLGPRSTQPPPDDPKATGRVCWIADPDGNIVELNEGYVDEKNPPPFRPPTGPSRA